MRVMKITAIEALKTEIKTMSNTTIPNKSLQTTTHHTIQMVMAVMKMIELGNGKENYRTLDTTVSRSTA